MSKGSARRDDLKKFQESPYWQKRDEEKENVLADFLRDSMIPVWDGTKAKGAKHTPKRDYGKDPL